MTCTGCNRVLFAEDGPVCPECLDAQRRREEEAALLADVGAEEENESDEGDAAG